MARVRVVPLLLVGTIVLVLIGLPLLVDLLTDWYWFDAVGYGVVFRRALGSRVGVGMLGGVVTFLFLWANLRLAQRGVVPELALLGGPGTAKFDLDAVLRRLSIPVSLGFALLGGLSLSNTWLTLLALRYNTPFGATDPAFGRDISYYVFTLPALSVLIGFAVTLIVLALLLTIPLYAMRRDIVLQPKGVVIEASAGRHLGILIAAAFVFTALTQSLITLPSLVYSTTGPLVGASYTDLVLRVPLIKATALVAILAAGIVLWGSRKQQLPRWTAIAVILYFSVAVVLGRGLPAAYQRLSVVPNELTREIPQIELHIAATQKAWGLDQVLDRELSGEATLTLADIEANSGTIANVRLWDRDPLLQTIRQLQEIRTYYDFASVDDDRYWIDGLYRQVLLSTRELSTQSLPQRTFINERLAFTHGMGITLSPVNEVTEEGLPVLFIKDLPPVSDVSLEVTRPGIYYGELSNDYVFVKTDQQEFDFPSGEGSAYTTYEGTGGVAIGSLFRRLLFSMRFGSLKILLSDDITGESRVMFHRRIVERVGKALPFLELDSDPYIVVNEAGELQWIFDGYTSSDRYPYAQPLRDGTNYIRNSVKIVLDAYHGTISAYIVDPDDPLIQFYDKVFPGTFLPLEEMPADMRAHIRYPDDLFRAQTALYTTYHMSDPETFYHREDQWQIPTLNQGEGSRDPFLRHIIMKLPGEEREEFIVMTPFTPRQKDNLAAWMVARSDGDQYGQLVAYRFPRQSLVFGPSQISNRINQNTDISRQISLWDQRGSQVIFGNLLVIPIEESLIFVQAIYLRADGGRIPELKRVVVASGSQVVMEETLQGGLARLFGGTSEPTPVTQEDALDESQPLAGAGPRPVDGTAAALIDEAAAHYLRAMEAQRAGDWALYGIEIDRLGEALQALRSIEADE